jgi:hypothetical protein
MRGADQAIGGRTGLFFLLALYFTTGRTRSRWGKYPYINFSGFSASAFNASIRHLAPYHTLVHGMLRSMRGDNKVCGYSQVAWMTCGGDCLCTGREVITVGRKTMALRRPFPLEFIPTFTGPYGGERNFQKPAASCAASHV